MKTLTEKFSIYKFSRKFARNLWENSLYAIENSTQAFYAIRKYDFPSLPLVLIFHPLRANAVIFALFSIKWPSSLFCTDHFTPGRSPSQHPNILSYSFSPTASTRCAPVALSAVRVSVVVHSCLPSFVSIHPCLVIRRRRSTFHRLPRVQGDSGRVQGKRSACKRRSRDTSVQKQRDAVRQAFFYVNQSLLS